MKDLELAGWLHRLAICVLTPTLGDEPVPASALILAAEAIERLTKEKQSADSDS